MSELEKSALEYATLMHKGKYRKGSTNEEYINHPIRVAELVKKYKGKSRNIETLVSAAFLHDTLEDTSATFNDLVERFGSQVAYLVNELTTIKELKDEVGKAKYLAIELSHMSNWALVIKLCDRLDNISDLENMDEAFRNKYIHETKYIIFHLLNSRVLTKTQMEIIKDITLTLKKYNKEEKEKSYLLSLR